MFLRTIMYRSRQNIFLFLFISLFGISQGAKLDVENANFSISDLCSYCICDYKNRDCAEAKIQLPLRLFSKTVNSSTELFRAENCDSGGLLRYEWLENAASSLRQLKINNCRLERVLATNASSLPDFRSLIEIDLSDNRIDHFQIDEIYWQLSNLTRLILRNNFLQGVYNFSQFYLKKLDLSRNRISETPTLPTTLRVFNISHNAIREIRRGDFDGLENLEILDLSHCQIDKIEEHAFASLRNLRILSLNGNGIGKFGPAAFRGLDRIRSIDLSANRLREFDASILSRSIAMEKLTLDFNPIRHLARFPADLAQLTELSIADTQMLFFDFRLVSALANLRNLILRHNRRMRSCIGALGMDVPQLQDLDISGCALTQLRSEFFANVTSLRRINIFDNPWTCDCRIRQWFDQPTSLSITENLTAICSNRTYIENGTLSDIHPCDIGVSITPGSIERTIHGSEAILDCGAYGHPSPMIIWEHAITTKIIGQWPPIIDIDPKSIDDDQPNHIVIPGGLLFVRRSTGKDVGPYRCTVHNRYGNSSSLILLRLDYSNWWEMKLYSVVCGIITAIGFFILNIIYLAIRRVVIWKISKLEQTSRVRLLLEAMEKYRQRQMETLHEKYTVKMNQIRDNYHGQVEQMRKGYVAQAERFRDYRAAQMESMSHHIDTIRDNYNWQANRVREYGSRQMERLWESYQRQVNRLRAFSLQQRLRLMRQYKINQRYWNKIFESVNIETGCAHQRNGGIRVVIHPEMIELPDLPAAATVDDDELMGLPSTSAGRQRSALIDDFDDAVSSLLMNRTLDDMTDDFDGSSYHSIPGDELEPLEAEILSQIDSDTEEAMREQIPPIIATLR